MLHNLRDVLQKIEAIFDYRDAYEVAFGVRPVFSLDYLTTGELQNRTAQLNSGHAKTYFR